MNNSSISALYRNVLAVLHIHLYNFFKASVPVAPGCVRQLNKSMTTATCPCKPEDQINNICSWQPNSHSHCSHSVWSVVHKSCRMNCLSNGCCWSLHKQASATAGHKITDPLCMQNFFKCFSPSHLFLPGHLFPSLGVMSLPALGLTEVAHCCTPHLLCLSELPVNIQKPEAE